MLSGQRKRWTLYTLFVLLGCIIVGGPLFLPVPVPAEEHQECADAAQKNHTKSPNCPFDEPEWKRTVRDPVAYFTFWLTIFTASLGAVGVAQIVLSREEFIATHRPKLRIRRIGNVIYTVPNQPATARIIVANVGESTAEIVQVGVDIYTRSKYRAPDKAITTGNAEPQPLPKIISVAPGEQAVVEIQGGNPITLGRIGDVFWRNVDLCALGIINYRDTNGVKRSVGFFRLYRPEIGRFYPAPEDDPEADREFED